MISVEDFALFIGGLLEQRGAVVVADRARRADRRAGGALVIGATLGTEITFHRVVADRAVGAGQCAFAATGAAVLIDRYHAGDGVF